MNVLDDLRNRLQDVYAQTEVFLNEAGELDPFSAAFVNWNGIAAALDAFEAEHPGLVDHTVVCCNCASPFNGPAGGWSVFDIMPDEWRREVPRPYWDEWWRLPLCPKCAALCGVVSCDGCANESYQFEAENICDACDLGSNFTTPDPKPTNAED